MNHIDSETRGDDARSRQFRAPYPIDRFDREVIEFLLAWEPYGDPPDEDAMPRFGMLSERLIAYAGDILSRCPGGTLNARDRVLVIRASAYLRNRRAAIPDDGATTVDIDAGRWVVRHGIQRWTNDPWAATTAGQRHT